MADEEDGDRLIYELRGGDQRFVLVFDSIGIAAESFEALVALFLLHSALAISVSCSSLFNVS